MYFWRRVYGEKMTPENGFQIEQPGTEPLHYNGLLQKLRVREQELFWQNIWALANNPDMLKEYGVTAVLRQRHIFETAKGFCLYFQDKRKRAGVSGSDS